MNWKFWQKKERPRGLESAEQWRARIEAEVEAEKLRKKAEWDALPDYRKAARIEFRYFQQMARKPQPKNDLSALAALQNINQGYLNQMASSPYAQMRNEIGRALWLESGGFR